MSNQNALPKVLCVDDEPSILSGLELQLRSKFEVSTAEGGAQALTMLDKEGPFEVVVSDMRMPEMDGAEFLTQVKQSSPTSIRILLTGYADVGAAKAAINEGDIFRYLLKPCSRDELVQALDEAVEQGNILSSTQKLLIQSYQLKKNNQELKSEIMHDLLLGIGTRQLMNISLDYAQNTALDHGIPYSIALFQIGGFDEYKAMHSPQEGMKALQTLAAHIQYAINNTGKLFRYDEQKIVLLLNETTYEDAKSISEYIVKSFKDQDIRHWPNEDGVLSIVSGLGGSDFNSPHGCEWRAIIQKALTEIEGNNC